MVLLGKAPDSLHVFQSNWPGLRSVSIDTLVPTGNLTSQMLSAGSFEEPVRTVSQHPDPQFFF